MHSKTKLIHIAQSCAQAASPKLSADAKTLLSLADRLDEQSAQIYLTRFCQKWGLEEELGQGAPASHVRRAPQRAPDAQAVMLGEAKIDELEAKILAELDGSASPERAVELRFEGLERWGGWAS